MTALRAARADRNGRGSAGWFGLTPGHLVEGVEVALVGFGEGVEVFLGGLDVVDFRTSWLPDLAVA